MQKPIALLLSVVLLAVLHVWRSDADSTFYPDVPRSISVASGVWQIAFIGRQPCEGNCKSAWDLVFRVTNRLNRTSRQLIIATGMAQADDVYVLSGDRGLILGKANGDVDQAAIVNLQTASVLRAFFCYSPQVSPNLRYLAFVYFFAPHGTPENATSNVYALLDMESQSLRSAAPGPIIFDNKSIGAVPIYPPENLARLTPRSLVSSGSRSVHRKISLFSWIDDTVRFTDQVGGLKTLVTVNFGSGMNSLHITTKTLKTNASF